ncbi:MAG: hypothetical protein ABFS35_15350 [Bacteroidota bacterium]
MKKNIFYTIFLMIISLQIFAQVNNTYLDYFREKLRINSKPVKIVDYKDIKGSPYLTDDFVDSKIYFRKDSVFKIPLRYNVFDQSMEYMQNNMVYAISNPEIIEKIEMDNWAFIYYRNNENIKYNSYYELLVSGKSYLLAKKDIGYREAEPPKPIVESEPAKFFKRKDTYYVVIDGALPALVKNKKVLLEIFKDKEDEIEKFIKKEKISYKKRKDIIRLVEYYNGL